MFRLARRAPVQIAAALLGLLLVAPATAVAAPDTAIEDYAEYQPQTQCRPKAKPGTTYLGNWLVRKYAAGSGR
ncbi:MAG: hypothetical protein ABWY33_06915 [Cellulomonas sp.]